jgi:hypothetical protein
MATVLSGLRPVTEPRPSRPFARRHRSCRRRQSSAKGRARRGFSRGNPSQSSGSPDAGWTPGRFGDSQPDDRGVPEERSRVRRSSDRQGRDDTGGVRRAKTELQERDRLKHAGRLGEVQTVKVVRNGEGGTKRAWKPATRNRNHRGDSSRSGPPGTGRSAGPMPTSAATWISVHGTATGGILCEPALARPSSVRRRQTRPTGPGVISPARGRRARFATGGSSGRQPNGETFAPMRRERAATLLGVPQGVNDGSGARTSGSPDPVGKALRVARCGRWLSGRYKRSVHVPNRRRLRPESKTGAGEKARPYGGAERDGPAEAKRPMGPPSIEPDRGHDPILRKKRPIRRLLGTEGRISDTGRDGGRATPGWQADRSTFSSTTRVARSSRFRFREVNSPCLER